MAANGTTSSELSSKQSKFIDALLVGSTLATAARTAGISPRTSVRWKQDSRIQEELTRRRKEQFNETLDAFRAGMPAAIALVLETIRDKETPRSIRLRAAEIWIDRAIMVHRSDELEARITELEDLIR